MSSKESLKQLVDQRLRWGRWKARRARAMLKYGRIDTPALFANSFPKSGTHLLTQVLSGFTGLGPFVVTGWQAITMFDGPTGAPRPQADILQFINRLKPGDLGYGHLHAQTEIAAALCRPEVAPFFILRDPRDVVVSHVFYVTELESTHVHHRYYVEELSSFDERLRVSILGRPELQNPFPDIAERFAPYVGWLADERVLTLRFEDFILDRQETLGRVYDHVAQHGFAYPGGREQAVAKLAAVIDPAQSPTFRSGKVGGWKDHFNAENKALFKQVTGDLLVRLGYEKDQDW
jgi:hypothetical protein